MRTIDIKPAHLAIVKRILADRAPHAEVWAFGSRAEHIGHESSDLDLVLRDRTDPHRPQQNMSSLAAAFGESELPVLIDVLDWARLPEGMRRQIQDHHLVIQTGV
jgi:DNA polymerase sigma